MRNLFIQSSLLSETTVGEAGSKRRRRSKGDSEFYWFFSSQHFTLVCTVCSLNSRLLNGSGYVVQDYFLKVIKNPYIKPIKSPKIPKPLRTPSVPPETHKGQQPSYIYLHFHYCLKFGLLIGAKQVFSRNIVTFLFASLILF